jgi:pimeloyl-ACP methyl ester carboxylesterase
VTHLVALIAAGLVVLYAGMLLMVWRFQEHIVFQPPKMALGGEASEISARRVEYRASDGVDLFGYLVGECSAKGPVMLAFHGNADLSRWLVPWAAAAARKTGACVMLPEYRGYDGIVGVPSYEASARDARAALAYVRDSMQVAPSRLVYFGHSLGTAIAAELAAVEPPRVLVLQSPFSTARAMAARMFVPGLTAFWGLLSRVHFDTIARVRSFAAPVWVAHGDRDVVIPVRMGREVFDAARRHGELLIVPNAGHNDVADVGGAEYWAWLDRAVNGTATSEAGEITPAARAERQSAP